MCAPVFTGHIADKPVRFIDVPRDDWGVLLVNPVQSDYTRMGGLPLLPIPNMLTRVLAGALCCFVATDVGDQSPAYSGAKRNASIVEMPRCAECVGVDNAPPHEDCPRRILDEGQTVGSDLGELHKDLELAARRHNGIYRRKRNPSFEGNIYQRKNIGPVAVNFNIVSRRLPGVFEIEMDADYFAGGDQISLPSYVTDIGAKLPLGGVFSAQHQLSGRAPHEPGEYPKPGRRQEQGSRSPSYPPVGTRVPLALFLGIGANPVLAWGILSLNSAWGRALCVLGALMMSTGIGLMLALGVPATWDWPL